MIGKGLLALRARKAAKAAKDSILRKGALEGMTLPGKLADCQAKEAWEGEIFIVEGDSAGGTAKMGRDRRTQAILPLRGKILNVERARLDRMLGSEQIKNLVIAMGTSIGDTFDIETIAITRSSSQQMRTSTGYTLQHSSSHFSIDTSVQLLMLGMYTLHSRRCIRSRKVKRYTTHILMMKKLRLSARLLLLK